MPGQMTQAQVLAGGPAVFRMGRRYGFMGGIRGEGLGGIVAMEREVALGPKPVLWDVWFEKARVADCARRRTDGSGGKWSELMVSCRNSDCYNTPHVLRFGMLLAAIRDDPFQQA